MINKHPYHHRSLLGVGGEYLQNIEWLLLRRGANENGFYCAGVVLLGPIYPIIDLQLRQCVWMLTVIYPLSTVHLDIPMQSSSPVINPDCGFKNDHGVE